MKDTTKQPGSVERSAEAPFAARNGSHTLSREYKGQAESQSITPKCSCGWTGRTVYQYQDTPIMDLIAQESDHMRCANAGVEPRRDSDVGSDPLLDALDEFGKRGGRMVFWTCPNGCRDMVDWNHDGGKSVATCRKCGTSNKGNKGKDGE